MLEQSGRATENFAWLCDSQHKTSLRVRSWSPDPGRGLAFFAPDFALNAAAPWLVGEETAEWPSQRPPAVLSHRAEPSAADFDRLHEEILARIARHEFEKVVPIVCEELEFDRALQAGMFPAAWGVRDHQFSYGFSFGGEGLCGVTPELLFSVQGRVLHTMALAGTGAADGPALLTDAKERREHDLVIRHIESELRGWGQVEIGSTQERPYGHLKHLSTPIRVELNRPPEFLPLVVRLHPTAALGGWPRRPAVEWLERQEFHLGRRRFGAPFGWRRGDDEMICVVAIRCLEWRGARAQLAAGCGVVAGSESLREWNELKLKRDSVYRNLGLAP